jgi:hypothetical protein
LEWVQSPSVILAKGLYLSMERITPWLILQRQSLVLAQHKLLQKDEPVSTVGSNSIRNALNQQF